jgi:hypothetical protein
VLSIRQHDKIKQGYPIGSMWGAFGPPVGFVLPPRKSSHAPKYMFTLSSVLKKAENFIEIISST